MLQPAAHTLCAHPHLAPCLQLWSQPGPCFLLAWELCTRQQVPIQVQHTYQVLATTTAVPLAHA
jgi:hypothetical protein